MRYNLSELCDIIGGGTPKTNIPQYWGGNIPWLSVKDFNNDRKYVYEAEKSITEEGLNNSAATTLIEGDIIISARGTVGEMAVIPYPMSFNQSCYGLRAKKEIVDADYLYYLVKFKVKELKHNAHGSVFDTITRDTFEGIEVDIPSKVNQQKIAGILAALDSKIETNETINHNLQQQAQALYKAHFPYSVEDELPLGWKIGKVRDIIELHDSKRIPLSSRERDKMTERKYPYYGATSVMDYVSDYIFDGCYLLLAEDGTVIDSNGHPILQYVWGKFWVNNHAHIITGKNGFSVESLLLYFSQLSVQSIVTGAVQPKISQANLCSVPVVIPPREAVEEFNNTISPLFTMLRSLSDENNHLAQLRDSLLPKLMSGEIDVSEVEI